MKIEVQFFLTALLLSIAGASDDKETKDAQETNRQTLYHFPSAPWLSKQSEEVKKRVANNNLIIGYRDGKWYLGVMSETKQFLTWPESEIRYPTIDTKSSVPVVVQCGSNYPIIILSGKLSTSF